MSTLEEFFNGRGLYDPLKMILFDKGPKVGSDDTYKLSEEGKSLHDFLFPSTGTIITKCKTCKAVMPFSVSATFYGFRNASISEMDPISSFFIGKATARGTISNIYLMLSSGDSAFFSEGGFTFSDKNPIFYNIGNPFFFFGNYFFYCKYDKSHVESMTLLFEYYPPKLIITKIGQEPDVSTLQDDLSDKFSEVLGRFEALDDFRKAQKSHSMGFEAGPAAT